MSFGKWRAGKSLGVLLGISLTSWGCTDEETGFFIVGNMVVDAPDCVASPEATSTLYSSGMLDVALGKTEYVARLLVGSQLAPRGDKTNLRTETMIATITGAEVQLRNATGQLSTEFTVPATGQIAPNGSEEAGFGTAIATLLPASEGAVIARDELPTRNERVTRVAEVRVFGQTLGGLDFESAPLTYVIQVCRGCLIDYPPDALIATMDDRYLCTGSAAQAEALPCSPGQDELVDCRTCATVNEYCLDQAFGR